jgi:hypothetical protein
MILTMKAQDAPTTTTDAHDTIAAEKVCTPTSSVDTNSRTIRSNAGSSCVSLTSSCSNSTSSSMSSNMLKEKKRVTFSLQQTAYFSPEQLLSKEERKSECWYSEAELNVSRDEARTAIQAMHHQLQLDAVAAAKATTTNVIEPIAPAAPVSDEFGSWILRCPEDETKIVCLRGIEKYADAAAKYAGQKRLVNSVLQQQSRNNEDIHVSLVSRTLSEPFKEVARYYAMKSAEEIVLSRKLEEEQEETERRQREEVATVLLLIMGQEHNRKQQEQHQPLPKTPSQSRTAKLQEASPIVTPRGSMSGKRPLFTSSSLSESRNVKSCIRTISDPMR